MFTLSKSALLGLAVTAAAAFTASNAQAAIYTDISGAGFTISDITDSNGAYGQPVIDADGKLVFSNVDFGVAFAGGAGGGKTSRLTFKVTLDEAAAPSVNLTEYGTIFTLGTGGTYNIFPYLSIYSDPFVIPPVAADLGDVTLDPDNVAGWIGKASVSDDTEVSSFWVIIDNDILALSNVGGGIIVDKKLIIIDIGDGGGGDIPEPASLGVLGLGAVALLARRRK